MVTSALKIGDLMYRFEETHWAPPLDFWGEPGRGPGATTVSLLEYKVVKLTPKGCFVARTADEGVGFWATGHKFVLLSAKKRFACPTVAEAEKSFRARKKRQLSILKAQIDRVERALGALELMKGARGPACEVEVR